MRHRESASELAHRLGLSAEAVCRHYLSAGRREGRYWIVGDVRNSPGHSLYVRLEASPKGPAGRWTDAQSGEFGDLLDVIRESLGLVDFADVAAEARRFLRLPVPASPDPGRARPSSTSPKPAPSPAAARRLFAMCRPVEGTLGDRYLRSRGLTPALAGAALRFHADCFYRPRVGPSESWPAIVAAVTDAAGRITGAHRTWLARDGSGKAPIETPRKAMGDLLGHAVRFGSAGDVLVAGEGIETVLSSREALPTLPAAAALTAAHLAGLAFPPQLRRLYIVRDNDAAGERVSAALTERARAADVEAIVIVPQGGDLNDDLRSLGRSGVRDLLSRQLVAGDVERFVDPVRA